TVEQATAAGTVVTFATPTISDLCDAHPTATVTSTGPLTSGAVFPLGTTTITYTAKDASGNQSQSSFRITVKDTTAPTISGPPTDLTVEQATAAGTVVTFATPTASDLCDAHPTLTASSTGPSTSGAVFPLGTTTITYTAKDASGN